MPNYVKNIVKMKGIVDLPLFNEVNGQKYLDFNRLIEIPQELCVLSSSMTEEHIVYFLTQRCSVPLCDLGKREKSLMCKLVRNESADNWHEDVFRRISHQMKDACEAKKVQIFETGKQYVSNYEKYGAPTWYEWRCQMWGTKRNAWGTRILDNDTIIFETAFNNPDGIIRKLGELYPDHEIEHWWADEVIGMNTGYRRLYARVEDVSFFERDADAYTIYVKCWGGNAFVYLDENGVVQYRDWEDYCS